LSSRQAITYHTVFRLSYFNLLLLAKGIDKGIDFELTPGTGKQKKNLQLCYEKKKNMVQKHLN
jgi:hypothetical protein